MPRGTANVFTSLILKFMCFRFIAKNFCNIFSNVFVVTFSYDGVVQHGFIRKAKWSQALITVFLQRDNKSFVLLYLHLQNAGIPRILLQWGFFYIELKKTHTAREKRDVICEDAISFQHVTKHRKHIEFVWESATHHEEVRSQSWLRLAKIEITSNCRQVSWNLYLLAQQTSNATLSDA
uniref:Uncharacterized protein n=1 Tax=Glossina palpalis gambiensis TaxID=67801 RepID=A0A1B0BCC5_9MUSC